MYEKGLHHTLLLVVFKIVKSLQCILKPVKNSAFSECAKKLELSVGTEDGINIAGAIPPQFLEIEILALFSPCTRCMSHVTEGCVKRMVNSKTMNV